MPSQKLFELAIAKQTAKGVPATAAAFRTRVSGGNVEPVSNIITLAETGSNRLPRTLLKVSHGVDGNPASYVRDDIFGMWLWLALGTKSAVAGTVNIASSSVASPTVITTTTAHGLTTGDSVTISGHSGSTPSINGTHTVTVTGATTFTIPVNVTAGGTGGTVTTGQHTHTITPANTLPYFTLWRKLGDLVWEKFVDCKIAQLEVISEAEQAIQMTATIVGTKATALSSATYATEAGAAPEAGAGETNTGAYAHAYGSGLLLVEGVAVTRMERIALTIANGAARQYGDSIYADDISEGAQSITIATRERVVAPALYNRLHYGSATPASGTEPTTEVILLTGGGLDFMWRRQATPERSIRFQTGSRVQVAGIGAFAPGTGDDPLRQEPTYTILDPDSGAAFTGIVKNDIAAY